MTLPRLYISTNLQNAADCSLGPDNLRYLKNVLRLKPGDALSVFDGFGHEYMARIDAFGNDSVRVRLEQPIDHSDKSIHVTLAQAVPKANKMDAIVKSAAELGVDEIIAFAGERSISRIGSEKAASRVERWQKIVTEAARCTRSAYVARVFGVLSFQEMLACAMPGAAKWIFWEEENRRTIRDVLTDPAGSGKDSLFIIIGPEGGLSKDEVRFARDTGFLSVTLGRRILKVETAAAAILSMIQYEKGFFSHRSLTGEE